MTNAPITARWAATRDSAKQAAGAFCKLTLRRPRWWLFVAFVQMVFALQFGLAIEERYNALTRLLWGSIFALVPTLGIASAVLGLSYLLNRRRFSQRLREGVVLESHIGERSLVLRGPLAESTLSFEGIAWLRSSGKWVFLQQTGSPVPTVWPADLFPPADLTRISQTIQTRTS